MNDDDDDNNQKIMRMTEIESYCDIKDFFVRVIFQK